MAASFRSFTAAPLPAKRRVDMAAGGTPSHEMARSPAVLPTLPPSFPCTGADGGWSA